MALIKFGALITSGSGSLGGHTIQHSKGGMQLRTKPISPRSGTVSQTAIRSINPILQAGWRALTDSQRKIWNDWPVTHGIFNANGDKHPLSGHSLWMKLQFNQKLNNFPFLLDPSLFNTGPELIDLWKNGYIHPYETFVSSGNKVLSAINSAGYGVAYNNVPLSVVLKQRYLLNINLKEISGDLGFVVILAVPNYNYISDQFFAITESFYHIFTINRIFTGARFALCCTQMANFNVSNISLKKLLP